MEIKDVQPNQGNLDLVLTITEKGDVRTFEKFGKSGTVCSAKAKDETGEIKLTLWNEDIDKVNVGDKIHLQNGWCSEYQGERQLSTGKFGKLEIIEKAPAPAEAPLSTEAPSSTDEEEKDGPQEEPEKEPAEESEPPIQEEEIVE